MLRLDDLTCWRWRPLPLQHSGSDRRVRQLAAAAALTGEITANPHVIIGLFVLLKRLTFFFFSLREPEAAPSSSSRSHVICPPLQFSRPRLLQQLLVVFVGLREWRDRGGLMVLLGVFVFWYVLLAGSLVLRGWGLRASFYMWNKQVFDTLACKPCTIKKHVVLSFTLRSCFMRYSRVWCMFCWTSVRPVSSVLWRWQIWAWISLQNKLFPR